jgi:hypothetical protein
MISRSVEAVVLSRSDGRLSDDQQFVDLAIAQLVVVGVAVTSPSKQNDKWRMIIKWNKKEQSDKK